MIRAAGFSRVKYNVMSGGIVAHRLRLAFVISAFTHILRLARAGYVFAREGVFGFAQIRPPCRHRRSSPCAWRG